MCPRSGLEHSFQCSTQVKLTLLLTILGHCAWPPSSWHWKSSITSKALPCLQILDLPDAMARLILGSPVAGRSDGIADALLPNTTLKFAFQDSKRDDQSAFVGALTLRYLAFDGEGVSAVVGAASSGPTKTAALVFGNAKVSLGSNPGPHRRTVLAVSCPVPCPVRSADLTCVITCQIGHVCSVRPASGCRYRRSATRRPAPR